MEKQIKDIKGIVENVEIITNSKPGVNPPWTLYSVKFEGNELSLSTFDKAFLEIVG